MLKLYATFGHKWNASTWYRTILPFRTAARMKLANPLFDYFDVKVPHEAERRMQAALYSDIIQHYQNYAPHLAAAVKQSGELGAYWETKEKWNFGPNFVMDTDDDLFNVEPLNPVFKTMGTRVDGKIVPKGHELNIDIPGDGLQLLYKDGEDGFSVEENLKKMIQYRINLKAVDLITCSTQGAADYVMRETGRHAHIFPNCIDFDDWHKVDMVQDDKIRILWQSSCTHFGDIWPLAAALGRVHKKHPNTEVIIFGAPYKWLTDLLDPDRLQVIGWTSYEVYMHRLSMLNTDISLAPLTPSTFNDVRSAIRFYETAATWKPAATLAQNTSAYKVEIQDGVTGMLFNTVEEFEQKLEGMILDRTLCRTMASNAKDWVRTNRDPRVHVPALLNAYQELRDARRACMIPPAPLQPEKTDVSEEHPDVWEREGAGSGQSG